MNATRVNTALHELAGGIRHVSGASEPLAARAVRMPLTLLLLVSACHYTYPLPPGTHSSSMAISEDGKTLYVANADADSVSIIDTTTRLLTQEILLNGTHPSLDANGNYFPAVEPRALVLAPSADRLYVTGKHSSSLYTVDLKTNAVTATLQVCAEPAGVLLSGDEATAYVACSNDSSVVAVDTGSNKIRGTATVPGKPWALAWSPDSSTLYVTALLGLQGNTGSGGPGITAIDPGSMKVKSSWSIPDVIPPMGQDSRIANGQARGLYDLAFRPGADELWGAHMLLATLTAETTSGNAIAPATGPDLVFENTVFPALTIFNGTGVLKTYLSTDAQDVPGLNGAFGDVVSGPHAFQFTEDGRYLLLVDAQSEDLLAVDAVNQVEATMLRPLPGHQPEGIVLSPDGKYAYVEERNTGDVAVIDVTETDTGITLAVDGAVIPRFASDPMPAQMRQGQHLFNSANSDELPLTNNHWVACTTCHIEGRSDAITWRFFVGPRDTPSNAGGMLGTGFLLHTGDRRTVQDYWRTINIEMGGTYSPDDAAQMAQLNALEAYVDHVIPVPVPPRTDPTLVAQGKAIFERADVGCTSCHSGPLHTDSGAGNPNLDLSGPVVLHDVGTCNTGTFPDVSHPDDASNMRMPCEFDTPALRGLVDSAPYFHDGSALTLKDALEMTRGKMGNINVLSSDEKAALIEYLRSL